MELFRELSRKKPEVGHERQLQSYRHACDNLGLVLPENVEALIVLTGSSLRADEVSLRSIASMPTYGGALESSCAA